MSFRFAYSTNAYTRTSLNDALDRIGQIGFDAVELLLDVPHLFPDKKAEENVAGVRKALEKSELSISNLNVNTLRGFEKEGVDHQGTGPTLAHPDPFRRKIAFDAFVRSVRMGTDLDAECISLTTGTLEPGDTPTAARERFVQELRHLLYVTRETNIRIGIEYEPGFLVSNTAELLDILDRLPNPRLGANLDLGHAVVSGEDPCDAVMSLEGRIWNVHLEDIKDGVHLHLPPGEGDIDFKSIGDGLRNAGYDGFVTLELYTCSDRPDEAGSEGLAWLSKEML